jgi:UDP-3-O-[3-hydroxymyristoyl] N-acetylglucosamine deacetylase
MNHLQLDLNSKTDLAPAPAARARRTLKSATTVTGVGVHSGETVDLKLIPAPAGTGLVLRSSSKEDGEIEVSPYRVVNTLNAVTLSNGKWQVQTVEHLLAALATAEVTDLYIQLDSFELPIMDGSGAEFYAAILAAGVVELDATIEPIRLTNAVWVVEGDKYLVALPHDGLRVSYHIDYQHPLLSGKSLTLDLDTRILADEILPARTFGFLRDVDHLKSKGLIKGASLDNAVVLTEDHYLNQELRFPEECIRHKVLDLIGDMYLLGRPIQAHFIASKAGHGLDVALARRIMTQVSVDELARKRAAVGASSAASAATGT